MKTKKKNLKSIFNLAGFAILSDFFCGRFFFISAKSSSENEAYLQQIATQSWVTEGTSEFLIFVSAIAWIFLIL